MTAVPEPQVELGDESSRKPLPVLSKNDWADTGRKGRVLKRRKDIPSPEYSPQQVCSKVMTALQLNDDPMLEYGAAVVIRFASSTNVAGSLTPEKYGEYIRGGELEVLVDNSQYKFDGPAKLSENGLRCLQSVSIIGPPPDLGTTRVSVQLSKEEERESKAMCWLVDAITIA